MAAGTSATRSANVASTRTSVERLERLAVHLVLTLVSIRAALAVWGALAGAPSHQDLRGGSLGAVAVSFGLTGVWLIAGSKRDRRAAALGGFFVTVSSAFAHRFALRLEGLAMPDALALVVRGVLPEAFFPVFLWRFAREFPRVVHLTRLDGLLRWGSRTAWLLCTAAFLGNLGASGLSAARPEDAPGLGWAARESETGLFWVVLFSMAATALGAVWARREDAIPSDRTRAARLLAALALGFAPAILYILPALAAPPIWRWLNDPPRLSVVRWITHVALLTMPIASAYAVFGQGLLSVRLVMGRAVRTALVRSVLAVGIALPAAAIFGTVYLRRGESLGALLAMSRIRVLLVVAAGATAAALARQRILRAVDGRLLGNGRLEESLRTAVQAMQGAPGHATALQMAAERAKDLVGARVGLVLEHDPAAGIFNPASGQGRTLPAASLIAALAAASPRGIVVDPESPGSVFLLLPEFDRNWVLDSRAALVVGMPDSQGTLRWLLCIGPSAAGHAYSDGHRRALEAMAASGALVLENRALRTPGAGGVVAPPDRPAVVCSACDATRPPGSTACSCGGNLVEGPLPFIVASKFRLVRLLGRGGMGVVFEAEDVDLGRRVALKTLPHVSSVFAVRLRVEARAMAGFIHPNLALVYGLETWHGTPVIVMEFLAGSTLARRIKRQGAPAADVARWGSALARGLVAVHGRGLLHRDVKPSNAAFTAEGTIKLLDFGLARLLDVSSGREWNREAPEGWPDVTPLGHVAGTPLYLSPEAAAGDPVSPAQDVWGLSLLLFEALTGTVALREFVAAHDSRGATARLPDIREWRPDCPAGLATLLAECLRPDPARRVRSAAEVAERLGRLEGQPPFESGCQPFQPREGGA